jgi:hypothetical protein
MSFVNYAKTILSAFRKAIRFAHMGCRAAEFVKRYIDRTNASDELKATVTAWRDQTLTVCAAIEAAEAALPD